MINLGEGLIKIKGI